MAEAHILTGSPAGETLVRFVRDRLPEGPYTRIVVKPNWVRHETDPRFPIRALVTDTRLIDAVLQACLAKYPGARSITVGDAPLQTCDWKRLSAQTGLDAMAIRYASVAGPAVRFLDLRRERAVERQGFMRVSADQPGDPAGYREVALDAASHLEPVSADAARFRVSDYDPGEMVSRHGPGRHRYLISASVLDADLVVNLPKMKTHQKAGITGALKNLVGINGDKACLVHHRKGVDEFGPCSTRLVRLQCRVRDALQKRSPRLFAGGRAAWSGIKALARVHTAATREVLTSGRVYVASGSWYGNDTIWRMIYDLNRAARYAPAGGGLLAATPQRDYVAIMDGICAGEGNGPLDPLPVDLGIVTVSDDPFLMDMAAARLMGFDRDRIPQLANCALFQDERWARFDPRTVSVILDGKRLRGLDALPVLRRFLPTPGWQGRIELASP